MADLPPPPSDRGRGPTTPLKTHRSDGLSSETPSRPMPRSTARTPASRPLARVPLAETEGDDVGSARAIEVDDDGHVSEAPTHTDHGVDDQERADALGVHVLTDSEIGKLNSLEQAFLIQDLRTLVYDFTKGEDSDVLLAPISRLLSTEGDSSDFLLSLRYKVVNASAIHHMTLARIRSALGITTVVSPAAGMWRFACDDPHGEQAAAAFVAAKVTSGMLTENPDDLYDDEVIDALDGHDLSGNPALQKAQRQCSSSSPEAWLYSSAALSIEGTDVRTKLIDITRASLLQSLLDETEMHDEELQPWVDIACDWLLLGLCEFTMGQALSSVEPVDWFQAVLYLFGTVGIKLSDHEECCEHSIECTGFTLNQFRSSALVYLFATVWHCFNEKQCHTVLQLMEGHLDGAGNWRPCVDNDHDGSDEGSEGMRIAS